MCEGTTLLRHQKNGLRSACPDCCTLRSCRDGASAADCLARQLPGNPGPTRSLSNDRANEPDAECGNQAARPAHTSTWSPTSQGTDRACPHRSHIPHPVFEVYDGFRRMLVRETWYGLIPPYQSMTLCSCLTSSHRCGAS